MLDTTNLPSTTGIYIFKKKGKPLYVGKSVNIKARVKSHVENAKANIKESLIIEGSDTIDTIVTDSEFKALLLEAYLIKKNHPKYNVIWKDNKSYLYIKVTIREKYPKILLVRKEDDKMSLYFGPFSSVRTASMLLKEIRKLVPYCTQKNISSKGCFYSKIGLCNPCPNIIEHGKWTDKEKEDMRDEYRRNIRMVLRILKGNIIGVLTSFYHKLHELSSKHNYEEAIQLRNKILRFEELLYRKSIQSEEYYNYNQSENSLISLKSLLQKYFPKLLSLERIECYDISNLSQKMATASMVVLKDGLISKPDYRKFKIKSDKIKSDFEMIEEILRRRLKQDWALPNLLVIDGGKPQIRTVLKVLESVGVEIPVVGLAKNPDRLVIGLKKSLPALRFMTDNLGFTLLRLIRDESHRFARKYHLFLRDRNFLI